MWTHVKGLINVSGATRLHCRTQGRHGAAGCARRRRAQRRVWHPGSTWITREFRFISSIYVMLFAEICLYINILRARKVISFCNMILLIFKLNVSD